MTVCPISVPVYMVEAGQSIAADVTYILSAGQYSHKMCHSFPVLCVGEHWSHLYCRGPGTMSDYFLASCVTLSQYLPFTPSPLALACSCRKRVGDFIAVVDRPVPDSRP